MRHPFGLTSADWVFAAGVDDVATLVGGSTITFWNAQSGGTQYTDLSTDVGGAFPVDHVTSSDGTDGYVKGTIPQVYGPDAVTTMWISADGGARVLVTATDTADVAAANATAIADLQNQVTNLIAQAAISPGVNVEATGVWPPRPSIAGPKPVFWIGDDNPTAGGTGMAEGDIYIDTAP